VPTRGDRSGERTKYALADRDAIREIARIARRRRERREAIGDQRAVVAHRSRERLLHQRGVDDERTDRRAETRRLIRHLVTRDEVRAFCGLIRLGNVIDRDVRSGALMVDPATDHDEPEPRPHRASLNEAYVGA
jgi:hypothetical protein